MNIQTSSFRRVAASVATTLVPVAAALIARLRAASDEVCRAGAPATPMTLSAVQTYKSCTHAAMDRAVRAIDWPTVTALYSGDPAIPATQLR